ncbi:MAG: glycoside hydrolase family 140 protein [Fimbriimonadaceae bacterium]|nr:glycoside hydrolase family 140 protein [Fimbriimonadaceae bacterium]
MTSPSLVVSPDGRRLLRPGGEPFFYLADTAWELLHRLDSAQTEEYLTTRASQGFTAIQTVILAERDGLRTPTPAGHVPFHDLDPARPNEDYFRHVDSVVARMNELGMMAALLPTWGDKVKNSPGEGPQVLDPSNARAYGRFIGARYRDADVLWILGGDRDTSREPYLETMRELALGLKEGDGGRHLMSFHPPGCHSSTEFVTQEDWLDVHMWQTGHSSPEMDTAAKILQDRALDPRRPVFDGEPCYENIPIMGGGWNPTGARFSAADVRRRAYRALLAGACGHTYGCNEIWMMHRHGEMQFLASNMDWRQAMHLPGANQMRHVRSLFASRPFLELEHREGIVKALDSNIYPDSNLQARHRWTPWPEEGADLIRPTAAAGKDYAFVYLPGGSPVRCDFGFLGEQVRLSWFDPRHGTTSHAGVSPSLTDWIDPPAVGQDWVLIADRTP